MITFIVPLLALALQAQEQQSIPMQFDAAVLKRSPPTGAVRGTTERFPGRLSVRNTPIANYIAMAYRVRLGQVTGPGWLSSDMYDLEAKCDKPWTDSDMRTMLQHLLETQLKLALHHDVKQQDGYSLAVDLKGGAVSPVTGADKFQPPSRVDAPGGVHQYKNTTMALFAYYLSQELDQPVVNDVPYTGVYNFVVKWSSGPMRIAHNGVMETVTVEGPGPTIFEGVRDIGLLLKRAKVPVDYLVIDHIERLPSE